MANSVFKFYKDKNYETQFSVLYSYFYECFSVKLSDFVLSAALLCCTAHITRINIY